MIFFFAKLTSIASMNLPIEVIQNIIQFTPLKVQLQINKKSRATALAVINPAKTKIRLVVRNYLLNKKQRDFYIDASALNFLLNTRICCPY